MTDTSLLNAAIAKIGITKKELVKALGLTYAGFWKKLNNQSEFKATEIKRIQRLLHLNDAERDHIFLPRIVIENHQKVKKEVMTMSFWNDEKKKEFKRQYEEYCSGSMGPEDKKRFEKLLVLLAVHDFQNKNSLPIYLLWGCLLALLVDAVYKAVIGGDWITPLGCLIGVVGFGTLLFFIASITPD